MKRKISTLLSIILVATSLIACDTSTQEVDTSNLTQTNEPISTEEVNPEVSTETETDTQTDNLPDFSDLYDETILLFNQLSSSTLDLDFEQQAIIDDSIVFKVKDFSSFDEINTHLLTIFSQEIVDEFVLIEKSHIEYDGELYGIPSDVPSNINIGKELSREIIQEYPITTIKVEFETLENGNVLGSKVFDFVCELIDENWIFTKFPTIQ